MIIRERLYKAVVHVYRDRAKYNLFRKSMGALPMETCSLANCAWNQDRDIYAIYLPMKCTPGAIAHECLHMTHYILMGRGVQGDFNNDEAQAYLLEFLVNAIHRRRK